MRGESLEAVGVATRQRPTQTVAASRPRARARIASALRRWMAGLVVAVALLVAAPAGATTMRPEQKSCPVCSREFEVWVVGSTNTFGGLDSDLFARAAGEDPVVVWVWTCPGCRYSAPLHRFEEGVSAATAERIRAGIEPGAPIAPTATQRQIPAWVQFDLAERILEMEAAPARERSDLAIKGAWAIRAEVWDLMGRSYEDPAIADAWTAADARVKELIAAIAADPDDGWQRCQSVIRAARGLLEESAAARVRGADPAVAEVLGCLLLLGHGESLVAAPVLQALTKGDTTPDLVRTAARRMLESIDHERAFQESYLRHAAEAIRREEVTGVQRAVDHWIMADTLRRLGRTADAREAFVAALGADLPLWLFPKAREMVATLGGAIPNDRYDAARKAAVAAEVARLGEPATAGDAARRLRGARDADVVAAIVPLLSDERRAIRRAAVLALRGEGDPGGAALDALAKVMADDEDQSLRPDAARVLAEVGSPRSGPAFTEELQWITAVRPVAVAALAATGEADAFAALLDVKPDRDDDVVGTLSVLANRGFADLAAAKEWHAAHAAETRRAWVAAGFREAGLAVPADPWKEEHVPLLLGWLSDERRHIRANAVRILRELSGRSEPWRAIFDSSSTPRATASRAAAVAEWKRWWDERKPAGERR